MKTELIHHILYQSEESHKTARIKEELTESYNAIEDQMVQQFPEQDVMDIINHFREVTLNTNLLGQLREAYCISFWIAVVKNDTYLDFSNLLHNSWPKHLQVILRNILKLQYLTLKDNNFVEDGSIYQDIGPLIDTRIDKYFSQNVASE